MDISIHAPREGRDALLHAHRAQLPHISIHAPREGRDLDLVTIGADDDISIHAPREGRDACVGARLIAALNFNPRAP